MTTMNNTDPYTIADRVAAHLAAQGISRVFVYPGGTIAPLVNGFERAGVQVEVFKHEQGAAYAALALARLTGQTQVVMVTSGPGVTNVLTPLADAWYDSTPLLLITGQVGTGDLNSGRRVRQLGFQEAPTSDLVRPISKSVCCPMNAEQALAALPRLLADAVNGRPGPVVLDFPMDVQRTVCAEDAELPAVASVLTDANADAAATALIADIATALAAARRPVLLLGQGAVQPGNAQLPAMLQALVARSQALVVTSLPGLAAWDGDDASCLGYIGHTGHAGANRAVHGADLLLVLGARLDVRQTGNLTAQFVPQGRVAWVNNDADELAHPRVKVAWSLHAEVGHTVARLLQQLPASVGAKDTDWQTHCRLDRQADVEDPANPGAIGLAPKAVLRAVARHMAGGRGVVTTGVGSHQQWAARHLRYAPTGWRLLTSGGHGAMGYDLPSAIGAALATPGEPVLCVVGDGSLLMNIQELASLAERGLPVKLLLLNNQRLGIVSQFQRITWGRDPSSGRFATPDFVTIARGFGLQAERVAQAAELDAAVARLWAAPGPVLLEVAIDHDADVVPMLLAGQTMDAMWQGHGA